MVRMGQRHFITSTGLGTNYDSETSHVAGFVTLKKRIHRFVVTYFKMLWEKILLGLNVSRDDVITLFGH